MQPRLSSFKNGGAEALGYLLLIAAVFVAYINVYDNVFLLDDEFLIQKNIFLKDPRSFGALLTSCSTAGSGGHDLFYRPMQGLIYYLITQFGTQSPPAFHFLNISLHAANACLVFLLGRKMGFASLVAWSAALLWGLHPVQTEAVAYMSATADPLYTFFCLAGLCSLVPHFSMRGMVTAGLCMTLGLFSKETAVIFPLLAMSCFVMLKPEAIKGKGWVKFWPLLLPFILYFGVRWFVVDLVSSSFYQTPNLYTDHVSVRFYTFLATVPLYLELLFSPHDLHMDHLFFVHATIADRAALTGLLLVILGGGVLYRGFIRQDEKVKPLAWGLLLASSAHILHTGILVPVNAIFLEHWLYLPSVGFLLGFGETMRRFMAGAHRKVVTPFACLFVLFAAMTFTIQTFEQNKIWKTPITLFEHILALNPNAASIHTNLANAYADKGRFQEAIEHYRTAIQLYDAFPQSHYNLARSILSVGKDEKHKDEAVAELQKALAMDPDFFYAYEALAGIYSQNGQEALAAQMHEKAQAILKRLIP